ncbi:alpha/beta-hydrolase [Schizopora paradoxa]|uniref:Alpha/beta-hydrolase n=1 Tax=Schizopora paradoxa TaxID=27342 RepID=A0A0H2S354_9AGAM|nr:alpha/beta-hydrolase [Schizopora paradoxa]
MESLKQIDSTKNEKEKLEISLKAFVPLLQSRRDIIESIKRETFQFGVIERQSLDVYYPNSSTGGTKPPILIFIYGGGLTSGDRVLNQPLDLVYKNCGSFFASRGILTVIPDYRLAPKAVYPEPVEDLRDAFRYVVANLGDAGDVNRVFLTGHSAGGTLLLSLLLSENPRYLENDEVKVHIKGIAPRGAGCECVSDLFPPTLVSVLHNFYEGQETTLSPLGLLKKASPEHLASLPPILIMRSEDEPPYVTNPLNAFIALFENKTGRKLEVHVGEGHCHMSAHMALNSGEGEQWGEDLAIWIKSS